MKNIYIVFIGETGTGKTKLKNKVIELLRSASIDCKTIRLIDVPEPCIYEEEVIEVPLAKDLPNF